MQPSIEVSAGGPTVAYAAWGDGTIGLARDDGDGWSAETFTTGSVADLLAGPDGPIVVVLGSESLPHIWSRREGEGDGIDRDCDGHDG